MIHRYIVVLSLFALLPNVLHARESDSPVDRYFHRYWKANDITPAARSDDAEFLRRVYLDLIGRIPSVAESREFLSNSDPNKRQQVIDRLLASPRFATHLSSVWADLLIPGANNDFQVQFHKPNVARWLRNKLHQNRGYNQWVHELISTPIGGDGEALVYQFNNQSPTSFYFAKELAPENLAASTAQVFMGLRLECAQCHDHPFADWQQDQFWELAAFFSGIRRQVNDGMAIPQPEVPDSRTITVDGTERQVSARFTDGTQPVWEKERSTREVLADWLTSADNPYFARAAVNRVWHTLLGFGLVEPVDEMSGGAELAYHEELLDTLAKEFVESGFDFKSLIRTIANSQPYQLSSVAKDPLQRERSHFASMPIRALSAQQLFDSLVQATGFESSGNNFNFGLPGGDLRSQFLGKFASQGEDPTEANTTILQALMLMNGAIVESVTDPKKSRTLAAVIDSPFFSDQQRIETLYLAALSRKPSEIELARGLELVHEANEHDGENRGSGLSDLLWVLLNSAEFRLNH